MISVDTSSLALADVARVQQFAQISRIRSNHHRDRKWRDDDGISWIMTPVNGHAFAISSRGPGLAFDENLSAHCLREIRQWSESVEAKSSAERVKAIRVQYSVLRIGKHSERILWFIHQCLLHAKSSVVKVADLSVAGAVWGVDRQHWPRHWRQDCLKLLRDLTWLHVAEYDGKHRPHFGVDTVLLNHVGDLRSDRQHDLCSEDCNWRGQGSHHHILINIGQGFLGALELFSKPTDEPGVREYLFPATAGRDEVSLRSVGRSGRLTNLYLAAKLGDPAVARELNAGQHRLIQALVRETTRAAKRRSGTSQPEVFVGRAIPGWTRRESIECGLLHEDQSYVGFNGNRRRKGLGYKLLTAGGWLGKTGYPLTDASRFLHDLDGLQQALGVIPVGVLSQRQYSLKELIAATLQPRTQRILEMVHLRVFAPADYLTRWNSFFKWPPPANDASADTTTKAAELLRLIQAKKLTQRAVANEIGIDPSFFSKILTNKKPWPEGKLNMALAWVTGYRPPITRKKPKVALRTVIANDANSLLAVAVAYRKRGLSIVPQEPGQKKPLVRWKEFQRRLPTFAEIREWWGAWPNAGVALILGPVSNVFVIDVDGPEARAAMLERLGAEPIAPKVLSGSGKPHRFHLYFRCPDLPTRAKQTPWHSKLEFRGQGGILIAPPSVHSSGKAYKWAKDRSPDELDFPALPIEVLEALMPSQQPARPVSDVPVGLEYVSAATRRFLSGAFADGPQWNSKLFNAACDLAGRRFPFEVAQPLLLNGAKPYDAGEQEHAIRTIVSAYSQPRTPSRD